MKNYPKWIYHATLPPMIVESPAEHEAMGEEWGEVPVCAPDEPPPVVAEEAIAEETPEPAVVPAPRRKRRD